jgi:CspA family cold shock protein
MSKSGTVKWFNGQKGFGFIETQDKDVFIHISAVHAAGLDSLQEGAAVSFDLEDGPKGPSAVNITVQE